MVEKQIKTRGIQEILGKKGSTAVLDSLKSDGRAVITGVEPANLKELETYFQNQGYKVNAIAEKMEDEKLTFSLVVKKPAAQMVTEFETESEFTKER